MTNENNAIRNTVNDNTTPLAASDYDKQINRTIPYYNEFYVQTLSVVAQNEFESLEWLDLGCGTGTLEEVVLKSFETMHGLRLIPCQNEYQCVHFVMADPSDKMLEQAIKKLNNNKMFDMVQVGSEQITYEDRFNVITAIQSHHYFKEEERKRATENVFRTLKKDGIYISYENVVDEDSEVREFELKRWGNYQVLQGKSREDADAHMHRLGVNYFPISVNQHVRLLKETGFTKVHVFWCSYMQMGIYGVK